MNQAIKKEFDKYKHNISKSQVHFRMLGETTVTGYLFIHFRRF